MPQVSKKDLNAQKAQDKESKRARGALSCAECRRLKLKCDKTVPCSSCKRRGCSAICPNGSLITGQGTRFVLADTEKLHTKISIMSDRIRQLEDALAVVQSTVTSEAHPLLSRDLMKIKSSLELHSAVEETEKENKTKEEAEDGEETHYIDAFGTLAIRDDGAATFYGRSAGSESLLIGELPPSSPHQGPTRSVSMGAQSSVSSPGPYTSPELANLAATFPLASSLYRPGIDLEYIVNTYIPSWHDATRLSQLYLEQAPWFFGAVTRRQLEEETLPQWYKEAPRPANPTTPGGLPSAAASPTPSNSSNEPYGPQGSTTKGGAHDLAILFMVFCFGSLTDMSMPSAPDNSEAEHYYQLAKACLTIEPVLERPPSVATVQSLSLMAIYEGICSKENSIESTWALFGMATKLAQSIGLHRDCARWKLSPGEVQKRRALFWELFITDCWQSLATGRLATFSLPFVDCELPFDPDQTMTDDGIPQPSFPHWKARFGAECVSAVVQGTLTSRAPKYSIIVELDRKVRDMELPLYAQGSPPEGAGLAQTMSHFMPTNYRELTLLYIHRCFFAHALSSNPQDPIKSQYAPSFLAGYRSACTIINSVKQQFTLFPAQIARFWVLWTHAFSASVMISSVVTHSPKSKVAQAAMLELKTACDLFEAAASHGGRAGKFLPILKRLQAKAQQVYRDVNSGALPPKIANDIFQPSSTSGDADEKDELLIFSGKTTTVATTSKTNNASSSAAAAGQRGSASPQSSSGGNMPVSRAGSGSPGRVFTDNPSFANVHPSLVNELNMFDVHIKTQIQNAHRAGGDVFGAPMVVDSVDSPMAGPGPSSSMHQQQQQQQSLRGAVTGPPHVHQQQSRQVSGSSAGPSGMMHGSPALSVAGEPLLQEQQQHQRAFLQQMENQRREEMQRHERQQALLAQQRAQAAEAAQQQQQRMHQEEQMRRQQQQQQQQQKVEQQRQEEYHHQQMISQQRMQHPGSGGGTRMGGVHAREYGPPSAYPRGSMDTEPYPSPGGSVAGQSHSLHRIPSRSLSNVQQAYQQQPPPPSGPYQQQHHHSQQGRAPSSSSHHQHHPSMSSSAGMTGSDMQGQHHVYSMSPEPSQTPISQQPHYSSGHSHAPSPATGYDSAMAGPSSAHHQQHRHGGHGGHSVTGSSASSSQLSLVSPGVREDSLQSAGPSSSSSSANPSYYWPAAPTAYGGQYAGSHGGGQQYHYTPEAALRGIAADDPRLQETWQTYMSNVGSPRHFLGD